MYALGWGKPPTTTMSFRLFPWMSFLVVEIYSNSHSVLPQHCHFCVSRVVCSFDCRLFFFVVSTFFLLLLTINSTTLQCYVFPHNYPPPIFIFPVASNPGNISSPPFGFAHGASSPRALASNSICSKSKIDVV